MNITGPVIALIAADSTANGLLGGRVYPALLRQSTAYPAAALNITGNNPTNTKTGPSDLDFVLLQVDIYGTDYTSASNAESAIRNAIDYKTSGAIESISYIRTIDGLSEKPELVRKISEYKIAYRR